MQDHPNYPGIYSLTSTAVTTVILTMNRYPTMVYDPLETVPTIPTFFWDGPRQTKLVRRAGRQYLGISRNVPGVTRSPCYN